MIKSFFESFSTRSFVINFIMFMVLIDLFIFIQGILSPEGYIFDFNAFIADKLSAAILCAFAASVMTKK